MINIEKLMQAGWKECSEEMLAQGLAMLLDQNTIFTEIQLNDLVLHWLDNHDGMIRTIMGVLFNPNNVDFALCWQWDSKHGVRDP